MNTNLSSLVEFNPTRVLKKNELYPYVDMSAIKDGQNITKIAYRKFQGGGSRFGNGDILLTRLTTQSNPTNIKSAVVKSSKNGWGSTEFIVMSPKEISDTNFIYYLTKFSAFRKYMAKNMSGTTRQRVSWQVLSKFRFNFPDSSYRKKAGYILNQYDNLIGQNALIIEKLEKLASVMFKAVFIDFEKVCIKQIRFQANEPGNIPTGWRYESLDKNIKFLNGLALQNYSSKGNESDLPILKIAQLKKGFAEGSGFSSCDIPSQYIIKDGDLIFSWSASLVVKIWCGGKAALNQHLFKVTSRYPKWFQWLWCKSHLKRFQSIAESKITTMGHIQRKHLTEAKILVPTRTHMKMLDKIFKPILDQIIQCNLEINNLRNIQTILIPKLIKGEIEL